MFCVDLVNLPLSVELNYQYTLHSAHTFEISAFHYSSSTISISPINHWPLRYLSQNIFLSVSLSVCEINECRLFEFEAIAYVIYLLAVNQQMRAEQI